MTFDELKDLPRVVGGRIRIHDKTLGVFQGTITQIDDVGAKYFAVRTKTVEKQAQTSPSLAQPSVGLAWTSTVSMPIEQFDKAKIVGDKSRPQIDYPGGFAIIFLDGDSHP